MELRMTLECLRFIGIRVCRLRGFSRAFELHEFLALMGGEIYTVFPSVPAPVSSCRARAFVF